jgi:hypothetical protein
MRTRENFPIGYPTQIAPSQALLTWRFFRDGLSEKKDAPCLYDVTPQKHQLKIMHLNYSREYSKDFFSSV